MDRKQDSGPDRGGQMWARWHRRQPRHNGHIAFGHRCSVASMTPQFAPELVPGAVHADGDGVQRAQGRCEAVQQRLRRVRVWIAGAGPEVLVLQQRVVCERAMWYRA